jgi:hypothetical protein
VTVSYRQGRRAGPPKLIGIHIAQCDFGAAHGVENWENSGGGPDQSSSHLIIGPDVTIRMIADEDTAFTQGVPWNDYTVSAEMTGWAHYVAEWASADGLAIIERTAQACAVWCVKWNIPPVRVRAAELAKLPDVSGICCHYDFTACDQANPGKFGKNDHSDPGKGFPIDALVARVVEILTPPPTPEPTPPIEDEDMKELCYTYRDTRYHNVWFVSPGAAMVLAPQTAAFYAKAGVPRVEDTHDATLAYMIVTSKTTTKILQPV